MKLLKNIIIITIVASVFFFSWLPNPSFKNIVFLPYWLREWSDQYGVLRTAIPFIPLSFITELYSSPYTVRKSLFNFVLMIAIALIAEVGQLLLPLRSFDWMDIVCAGIGSIIGFGIAKIISTYIIPKSKRT